MQASVLVDALSLEFSRPVPYGLSGIAALYGIVEVVPMVEDTVLEVRFTLGGRNTAVQP